MNDGKRDEQCGIGRSWGGALALRAPLAEILYLCLHSWPVEVVLQLSKAVSGSQVAPEGMRVCGEHEDVDLESENHQEITMLSPVVGVVV